MKKAIAIHPISLPSRLLALSASFPLLLPFSLMAEVSGKTSAATLAETEAKIIRLTGRAREATVSITHSVSGSEAMASSGSGTIISPIGLILTAAHVVRDADQVDIRLADGKEHKARVLGCDNGQDVALVLLSDPGPYPYVTIEDKKDPAVGDTVIALGHPGGFDPRRPAPVRMGHVLGFDKERGIRTDCVVSGGDSGGPLLNLEGKLIGAHSVISNAADINFSASVHALDGDWEQLAKGERFGTSPQQQQRQDQAGAGKEPDLEGLDQEKFSGLAKALIFKKNGGGFPVDDIRAALIEAGLPAEKAHAISPAALAGILQKSLAGGSPSKTGAAGSAKSSGPAPKGLDTAKLRQLMQQAAISGGGQLKLNQEQMRQWMIESGMDKFQADLMSGPDLRKLFLKVMSGGPIVVDGNAPAPGNAPADKKPAAAGADAPKPAGTPDFAGMDPAKFREILLAESGKAGSENFLANSQNLQAWMIQAGMDEARAKALSSTEVQALINQALQQPGPAKPLDPAVKALRDDLRAALAPVLKPAAAGLVEIHGPGGRLALGCAVRQDGFILTKHSEAAKAGEKLTVRLREGRELPGKIVKAFPSQDLALVKIDAKDLPVTAFQPGTALPADGTLLAAPGMEEGALSGFGACSVADVNAAARGYFGFASASNSGDKAALTKIDPDGPAGKAGLQAGDLILSLNDQATATGPDLKTAVGGFAPGDTVKIRASRRDGAPFEKEITLTERPANADPTAGMGVNLSEKRQGFPRVIQTDLPLTPQDCGGLLLNLKGEPVGLTIARASRTATYALPASQVASLLRETNLDDLGK